MSVGVIFSEYVITIEVMGLKQIIDFLEVGNYFGSLWEIFINVRGWNVENILAGISIVLVIIGGIFGYHQWATGNKTKRTELIYQIVEKMRFDKEMANTMYMIDYNQEWYGESFHKDKGELEYKVDKLLAYMSYVCYLYREQKITNEVLPDSWTSYIVYRTPPTFCAII